MRRLSVCLVFAAQLLWAHDPHDPIQCVAVSPDFARDKTVLAATGQLSLKIGVYALLKSTDDGANWSVVANLPNNSAISAVVFSPAYREDKTVFVAGAGGLFQTTDRGETWTQWAAPPLQALALSPSYNGKAADRTLFAIAAPTTSSPNGQVLSSVVGAPLAPLPAQPAAASLLTSLAVSGEASGGNVVVGSIADGIFQSANGAAWVQTLKGHSGLGAITALAYSPAFASDQTIFAGASQGGFLISKDGGNVYATANQGLSDAYVTSLAVSPTYAAGDHYLWLTTADASGKGGVFESSNGGASWVGPHTVSRELDKSQAHIHYQAVAAGNRGSGVALYLAMYEGLWQWNSGAYQYIATLPTRLIRYINLSPAYALKPTVFASTYGGGNLWLTDGGTSWTFENTGMQFTYTDASAISPDFESDGIAFSGNRGGLQTISKGSGGVWAISAPNSKGIYPRALALSSNFATDCRALVGTSTNPGGVYAYTGDGPGCHNPGWSANLLPGQLIYSIAVSPDLTANSGTAFAASGASGAEASEKPSGTQVNGLFKSVDGGNTWAAVTSPTLPDQIGTVAVAPTFATDGGVVFAAANNGGLYISPDAGSTWALLPGTSGLRIMDLAFSANYAADKTLFVGTVQKGLLQSVAGGPLTAVTPALRANFVTAVAVAGDGTMFAATYQGLYKLPPGARAWTYTHAPARIEESANTLQTSRPPLQPPTIAYCSMGTRCNGPGGWAAVLDIWNASAWYTMQTRTPGDYAVLEFTGTGVDWVTTGSNLGTATVQLDQGPPCTVALAPATAYYQQTVWSNACGSPCSPAGCGTLACARHKVTITNPSTQTVSVDAFEVWTSGCPQVGP